MNFKDSYKQINENRKPDKEFLNQLAKQMEATQQKRKNIMPFVVPTALTAAAAMFCFLFLRPGGTEPILPSQDITQMMDAVESFTPSHEFDHENWQDSVENTDDYLGNLQTLLQSEEIRTAYCADTNTFEKEDTISAEELASLTDSLVNAKLTDTPVQGDCQYYMLVFANNSIVKFEIYDAKHLKIKGSDAIYLLPEKN